MRGDVAYRGFGCVSPRPAGNVPYRPGLGDLYSSAIGSAASLAGNRTSTVGAIASGAATGASIGSVVPIAGTAIGAILGAIGGGIAAALNRKDQEVQNFDQAGAMWAANRLSVLGIPNKYLVLAGLFDLHPGQIKGNIPIYKKYGRMGEAQFVRDLMAQVQAAAQNGRITSNDTLDTVMQKVVQPWIDSFGFGPMQDMHTDMINLIIQGMIGDYVTGNQRAWVARGGDYPFASIPPFSLPSASAPSGFAPPVPAPAQPAVYSQGSQGGAPVAGAGQWVPPPAAPGQLPAPGLTNIIAQPLLTPAVLLSQGFQAIGTDPSYGTIFQSPSGQPMVLVNGQLNPYARQIPSFAGQAPSYVSYPPQAVPTPPGYPIGGAAPQVPQTAGLASSSSLWIAGGLAVLAVLFATARPAQPAAASRKG